MGYRSRFAVASSVALTVGAIVVACSNNTDTVSLGPATWRIDCVAVLGAPPPSSRTPLAAMPYSGLPRDVLISALTPAQIVQLSNFDICMSGNGYLRNCYSASDDTTYGGALVDGGPFRLETVPQLAERVQTCDEGTSLLDADVVTLEDIAPLYQEYFGSCHVGVWEDCTRETAWGAWGAGTPDCETKQKECPFN